MFFFHCVLIIDNNVYVVHSLTQQLSIALYAFLNSIDRITILSYISISILFWWFRDTNGFFFLHWQCVETISLDWLYWFFIRTFYCRWSTTRYIDWSVLYILQWRHWDAQLCANRTVLLFFHGNESFGLTIQSMIST